MPTIATLSAVLELDSAKYRAELRKAARELDAFDAKQREVRKEAGKALLGTTDKHLDATLRGLDRLGGKMGVVGKSAFGMGQKFTAPISALAELRGVLNGAVASLSAFAPAAAAVAGGAFAKQIVQSAAAAQTEVHRLTAALRTQGITSEKVRDDILEYSTALQMQSTFGDEAITAAQTHLIMLARLSGDGLKQATKATLDYASATGTDLVSAAHQVSQAAVGNIMQWRRLGFTFSDTSDKAKTLRELIEQINSRFGGMAAAEINTAAGAWTRLKESFGDLLEVLGGGTLPVLTDLATGLREVVLALQGAGDSKLGAALKLLTSPVLAVNAKALAAFNSLKAPGAIFGDDTNLSLAEERLDEILRERAVAMKELAALAKQGIDADALEFLNKSRGGQKLAAEYEKWAAALAESNRQLGIMEGRIQTLTDGQKTPTPVAGPAGKPVDVSGILGSVPASKGTTAGFLPFGAQFASAAAANIARGAAAFDTSTLGLDATERAVRSLTDDLGRLQSEWERFPGLFSDDDWQRVQDIREELEKIRRERLGIGGRFMEDLNARNPMLGRAANSVVGSVPGMSGQILGEVMQSNSAPDALARVGTVLLTSSKQFAEIFDNLNPLLQSFADVIGTVLQPLVHIVRPISESFGALFKSLEPLLGIVNTLNPIFLGMIPIARALGYAADRLAKVLDSVFDTIIGAAIGFLKAIRKALDRIGISWKGLDDSIKSLKRLRDATDDAADQMARFAEILPEGYRLLELRRYQTAPAVPPSFYGQGYPTGYNAGPTGGGGMSSSSSAATSGGGSPAVVITGPVTVQANDPEQFIRAITRRQERNAIVRTGGGLLYSGGV